MRISAQLENQVDPWTMNAKALDHAVSTRDRRPGAGGTLC